VHNFAMRKLSMLQPCAATSHRVAEVDGAGIVMHRTAARFPPLTRRRSPLAPPVKAGLRPLSGPDPIEIAGGQSYKPVRMNGGEKTSGGPGTPERFDDILVRLRSLVDRLEGGNLSLEDSLRSFEEGMELCRRGASILDEAEKRVEVLLAGPAGSTRTAPLDTPERERDDD